MQRTVKLKLQPTPEQAQALADTTQQFTTAFNDVCAYGWAHTEKNGVQLHHATYYAEKAACPGLVSDLVIQARVKATEALKSAFVRQRAGHQGACPYSHACPPRYNVHTYTMSWDTGTVRLSTVAGRMTMPFTVPDYGTKYAGLPVDTADLIQHHDGSWWLHVVVTLEAPVIAQTDEVIGIDLGLAHPAVTSTNQFLGKKAWKATEGRYFRLKRRLQRCGSKSAKRHLRHLRHKQARFRRDCDHVLSKQLVESATPGGTLVLENLTNVRQRMRAKRKTATKRRMHSWSFAQLTSLLTYKAEERGLTVAKVDPRHTSQTCSCCGHQARNNRRSQSRFVCRACGFELHADLNAARNIAAKYRASRGISSTGAPLSTGVPSPPRCSVRQHASPEVRDKLSPLGDSR
jgi:IS605 OrfB family transposase